MVLHDVLVVLAVYDRAFVNHDLGLVPLAEGILVLRNGGNHVVERRRLAVAVDTQLGIGMVGVVEHLILGARDVDRLVLGLAVLLGRNLLGQVEDARVAALRNLPLHLQFEVLELLGEDQVAALAGLGLAAARAVELDGAVLHRPARRSLVLAVAAPAVERLAVENHIVAVLVLRERGEVHLRVVDNGVFGNSFLGGFRIGRFSRLGLAAGAAARNQRCGQSRAYRK